MLKTQHPFINDVGQAQKIIVRLIVALLCAYETPNQVDGISGKSVYFLSLFSCQVLRAMRATRQRYDPEDVCIENVTARLVKKKQGFENRI